MTTYVVTEGPVEQAMMKRLVRDHAALCHRDIEVLLRERIALESVARTILSTRHEPVALVMDTKTIDQDAIAQQRGGAEWLVGAAGPREDWEIVLVVPEVTVLLFQDEEVLRSLLPAPLSFEQRVVARYEPKRILSELFAGAGKSFPEELIRRISETCLAPLWKWPVLQPLEQFLLGNSRAQHPANPA